MDINTFKTNPLRVGVYNPITNNIIRTYVCIGDVPKNVLNSFSTNSITNEKIVRDYFGPQWRSKLSSLSFSKAGGDDADSDYQDIERLLRENDTPVTKTLGSNKTIDVVIKEGIEYYTNLPFYPEDNLMEVREKIFIMTGIPVYRQHLFYFTNKKLLTTYKLYSEGLYPVDCRKFRENITETIFTLPIDRNLYNNRAGIKVETLDKFQILQELPGELFVVDLNIFLKNLITQIQEIRVSYDSYQLELIYYGFIIKYWPILTPECFLDYVDDEREMVNKYPLLAKSKLSLISMYNSEKDIINSSYTNISHLKQLVANKQVVIAISSVIAYVSTPRTVLNIRNLFDRLRVSHAVPEIHARFSFENRDYLVRKQYVRQSKDIMFPTTSVMKRGVTIAISNGSSYLFLSIHPDGKYYIKVTWNEEDEYNFTHIIPIIKKIIDPVISGINKLDRTVFTVGTTLNELTVKTINYQGLNVCIFWKKILLDGPFKAIRGLWLAYMRARIATTRNVQQFDKYEFLFRKGIYQFDIHSIEKIITSNISGFNNNFYSYLSNNTINQKWDQNFDGRIVRMMHRISDVKFEIIDVREDEFNIFFRYLLNYIYDASQDLSEIIKNAKKPSKDIKKLKKLREQDPELYNLKKFGSKNDYSVRCQNPRQPLIFTDDEINNMSKKEIAKLVKYWNFTMNKPIYYGCPSTNYPHLSFITGVHPKHYCLPCCNKRQKISEPSKRGKIAADCLKFHTSHESFDNESSHIMTYGKEIEPGRISRAHPLLANLFMALPNVYNLYGVDQYINDINVSILFALSATLDIKVAQIIEDVAVFYKQTPRVFYTSMGGKLAESFVNSEDFTVSLRQLIKSGFVNDFKYWSEFFIEAFYLIYDVITVTFTDHKKLDLNISSFIKSEMEYLVQMDAELPRIKFMILSKKKSNIYPVYEMVAIPHVKKIKIKEKYFGWTSDMGKLIRQMFEFAARAEKTRYHNLSDVAASLKPNIKYIGKRNLCYGVGIPYKNANVFIPVEYSLFVNDNIPITYEAYKNDALPSYQIVEELAGLLHLELGRKYSAPNYNLVEANGGFIPYSYTDEKLPRTYDWMGVNAAILNRESPAVDKRSLILNASLYQVHLYDLFVLQFVNFTERERNKALRDKIIDLLDMDVKIQHAELKNLLGNWSDDLAILRNYFADYYYGYYDKKTLQDKISSTVFDFDRTTIMELKALERAEMYDKLLTIMRSMTVEKEFDMSQIKFENIYLPCNSADNGFCEDKKLIVNPKLYSVASLTDILVSDIRDSLRGKYLLESMWESTVINYFDFIKQPLEVITIYKLNE